jgi:hypothetical protein
MAIKTLQVTQSGSAVQVSATAIKARWVVFQDNAAAVARIGDSAVSATKGIGLSANGGSYTTPVVTDGAYHDLSQWWTIGTSTQLLDVVYDEVKF